MLGLCCVGLGHLLHQVPLIALEMVHIPPFSLREHIAEGGAGTIYTGKFSGKNVAVKELKDLDIGTMMEEAAQMVALDHPNILIFYGISQAETASTLDKFLIMEFANMELGPVHALTCVVLVLCSVLRALCVGGLRVHCTSSNRVRSPALHHCHVFL